MGEIVMASEDATAVLDLATKENIREYAPVIAYIALVMVFGIVGNVMTFVYYFFKARQSTNAVLLSSLAAIDLLTSIVVSDEIIQICLSVTFKSIEGCRFIYFINHWLVSSSVLVLWIICIDRYRKVCRYFAGQFTMVSVKVTIAFAISLALVVSIPSAAIRDIVRLNVTDKHGNTTEGSMCTRSGDQNLRIVFTALNAIDVTLLSAITVTFIVLYSLIIKAIFVSRRKTQHTKMLSRLETISSISDGIDGATCETVKAERTNKLKDISAVAIDSDAILASSRCTSPSYTRQRSTTRSFKKNLRAEYKISLMMIAMTVVYMVSFIPYFIVNLLIRPNAETEEEFNVGTQLALRSYMINNAVNPYIVGVFNTAFREFVLHFICKCCFKY